MSALLNAPEPKANEHRVGYLRRLASCNGYYGWRDLVRAAGFKPTKSVIENEYSALLSALGISISADLLPRSIVKRQQTTQETFERPKYEPVCIHCLQDSEHLRHEWSHCLVVACPEHQCLLVDRCPRCNAMLENTRSNIAQCDCGYDLRFAEPATASPMQCWASARMTGDMRSVKLVDEIGTENDYRYLADLFFQLGTRFDPCAKIKQGTTKRPSTVEDAVTLLAPLLDIFEDVQPRFTTHIEMRFAAGNQAAFNLYGRLGSWFTALDGICRKAGAFPIIWEIFSDAVFDNFDGFIRGQTGLTPSPNKQRQFLGVAEAAKLIGVSKPTLQEAIERKQIEVRTGCEGINYAVHMVPRAQCEAARQLRADWMSPQDAANFIGVPKSVLRHLANASIVVPDQKWSQTIFKGGPFSKMELSNILQQIEGHVQPKATGRTLRLDQIDARRTVDIKALVRVYRAIFSGELRPIGRSDNEGLAGFLFSAEEVMKHLGSIALDKAFTLNQVATATGWKYQCVAAWAKQNLLESEPAVLQGVSARVVTIEGLARFRREWIPVSEIAASLGSKGSAVSKHLVASGIVISGQSHEKNGAARGGLIRMSDLGRLAGLVGRNSSQPKGQLGGRHVK